MPQKRQFNNKFSKKPFKRTFNSYSNSKDEDNGEESSSKRFKSASTSSSTKAPDGMRHTDEEGNFYWELGGKARRVTVSEFPKGNVLVSVREYFEKDGKFFPGKKGISMSLDQFNQLIRVLPALEEAIGQKTSTGVVRPIYTTSAKHEAPKPKKEIKDEEEEEEEEEGDEKDQGKQEEEEEELVIESPPKKSTKKAPPKKTKVEDSEEEEEEDESEEE
ncbi:hypothetical protein ABW19_dt0205580 [Dactylella cylindrospora]|nr:hypothetical protein ABW19_dt0205580 [Dactylella cylindrospora]